MNHTLIAVPKLIKIEREPIHVLPIDESKMVVMYKNRRKWYGFALYDVKKGILFDHCPSSIYYSLPKRNLLQTSQRIVTVPYSYTPCLSYIDRDYSAINLIYGRKTCPFQLEINSYTGEMEIYPVKTYLLLGDYIGDSICRFNDNELFIFQIKEAIIYNLNTRTCKYLHKPLMCLSRTKICYFKNCIYVVQSKCTLGGCDLKTQRYNLNTDEWESTGNIYYYGNISNLVRCQSRLYAIRNESIDGQAFIWVFNEGKKRWEICRFPPLNLMVDVSSDYYSGALILRRNYGKKNEIYLYSVNKGDLAMSSSPIGMQRSFKKPFGVINLADTYIRFGINYRYGRFEFQCLDPRKDENLDNHGLKNIDWNNFKIRLNEFANLVIGKHDYYRWYVLPNHNRKEAEN